MERSNKFESKNPAIFIFFLVLIPCFECMGGTIPDSRNFTEAWHAAGYPGEIPNRAGVAVTHFGAVGDGTTDDTQAIIDALNWTQGVPDVYMAYFPAGTYKVTSTINLPAGAVLRGERDPSGNLACLEFDFSGGNGHCISISGSSGGSYQSFSPQSMHAEWIDVEDASEFNVGDYVELRQDNDPAWDNGDTWAQRAVGQILQITGISGNRLHLEHELRADYIAQFNPEVRKVNLRENAGIDNLKIIRTDGTTPTNGNHISFYLAGSCWVRGVEMENCVSRLVNMRSSTKIEITGCYLHHAFDYGGGGHAYGTECSAQTGDCLIENNIFVHLRHSMLIQNGGNGNVFGYNYSTDPYRNEIPHDYASDIALHGNRGFANLFEGNIVYNLIFDGSHGEPAGPYNTAFRNSAGHYGLMITTACDDQNIVGNDITDGLLGQYILLGSGHFEWGNREKRWPWSGYNVIPEGSESLPDYSYYLSDDPFEPAEPDFWTISESLPTIGSGATVEFGTKANPARYRYLGPGPYTVGTDDPLILVSTTPSPTPSHSPTITPTTTTTETPSRTPSPEQTSAPTKTPTLTPSFSPTASNTPAETSTPSPTFTASPSPPVPSLQTAGIILLILMLMPFVNPRSSGINQSAPQKRLE